MKNKIIQFLPLFVCIVGGYMFALQLLDCQVSGLDGEMKAIFEPLTGHAWWRAWQNRYLAGIIANAIGYVPFFVFGFIALNIVTYYLYDKNIWIVFAQWEHSS